VRNYRDYFVKKLIIFACNLKKMNYFKIYTCNFLTPCIIRFLSDRKRKFCITSTLTMHACFIWSFRIFFHAIAFFGKRENFIFTIGKTSSSRLDSFRVAACHWSARLGQMHRAGSRSYGGYSRNRLHTRICIQARTHMCTHTQVSERACRADSKLEYSRSILP